MPKNVKQKYSKKEFDKDLKELEILLKEGGSYSDTDVNDESHLYGGNMDEDEYEHEDKHEDEHEDDEHEDEHEDDVDDVDYDFDYDEEQETLDIKEGGKKIRGPLRHFKLIELNGKPTLSDARPSIDKDTKQTPITAARKMLTSITRNMSDATKLKSKTIFKMKETTRTSANKVYGPYIGTYLKGSGPVDFKKEDGKKVTVNIKFKPVIKLYKGEYKGGSKK